MQDSLMSLLDIPEQVQGISREAPSITAPRIAARKKSGLDNVLGFLGDFLTSRLGMGTPYRDNRQNDRLHEAMQAPSIGAEDTPEAMFDRVADINAPMAIKLRDQQVDNARLAAAQASTAEYREARLAAQREAQLVRTRGIAASYLGSIAGEKDEKKRAALYPAIRSRIMSNYGRDDPEMATMLPEKYDPVAIDGFRRSAVPSGMQFGQELTRETAEMRDTTTRRGQDINDNNQDENRSQRGVIADQRNQTTRRGQDLVSRDRGAVLKERNRHNEVQEGAPKNGDVRNGPDGKPYQRKNGKWYPYPG